MPAYRCVCIYEFNEQVPVCKTPDKEEKTVCAPLLLSGRVLGSESAPSCDLDSLHIMKGGEGHCCFGRRCYATPLLLTPPSILAPLFLTPPFMLASLLLPPPFTHLTFTQGVPKGGIPPAQTPLPPHNIVITNGMSYDLVVRVFNARRSSTPY